MRRSAGPPWRRHGSCSLRVVKDDAERAAMAGARWPNAVTQFDPIAAAGALCRPMVHRENHAVPLSERHDLCARLHTRTLFREHEFAAREIPFRRRQQERGLQRKDVLAVQVLVQAVEVSRAVLQEERRRPGLPGAMAATEKSRMTARIANL